MQKKILTVGFLLVMALFVFHGIQLALAVNEISVNPGKILVGETVTITLTTERAATGTITVNQTATGNSWSINIDVPAGTNNWTFPTKWPVGANTDVVGYYDVLADITMVIAKYEWHTEFEAGFLAIPEILGPIMTIVACFGAAIGYTKLRRRIQR